MFIEFKIPNAGLNPPDPFLGVDVKDDETTVRLIIDVPGMKTESVRVELHEGLLLINCRRIVDTTGLRYRSRNDIVFAKSFTLDETLDNDRMEYGVVDGVLEVVLWKKAKPQE